MLCFWPVPPFIPTFPFIKFGGFCQPPCWLRRPRLLFWPKFASLPVYSVLPFYLKLESKCRAKWSSNISQTWDFYEFHVTSKLCCISVNTYCFPNILPIKPIEKDAWWRPFSGQSLKLQDCSKDSKYYTTGNIPKCF